MDKAKSNFTHTRRLVIRNTLQYAFVVLAVTGFMNVFGTANTLVGVALVVGLLTYPECTMDVKPLPMAVSLFFLYLGCGIVPAISSLNIWLGIPLNFGFTLLILLFSTEPTLLKPHICLMLCFLFCQSTPVHGRDFLLRMAGLALGGLLISGLSLHLWHKRDHADVSGRSLCQQINLSAQNHGFLIRMSAGIAIAMFIAAALQLKKPLWISIVVMSLTQIHFKETISRIKYRGAATICGVSVFAVFFLFLVPPQFDALMVMALGYIGNYTSKYKYNQFINSISALNASLILLDGPSAIVSRLLCLLIGIVLVLLLNGAQRLGAPLWKRLRELPALGSLRDSHAG